MDVTDEYLKHVAHYGGSESMRKEYYAAQKTLNYGTAGTIDKADNLTVISAPQTINYKDDIGLFGLENYYLKVFIDMDPNVGWLVSLENNQAGNKYESVWLDISLLDSNRKTAADLKVKGGEYFYVGVHSRNTRRLPYDFDIKIEIDPDYTTTVTIP